eukprot:CAMPEP_0184717038 /NCGR_PEP_ID=MMETSP0314-20130426/6620_1 /TAXON_ID=38298 /ORGANISM="Rhodella maculata, Strain CCMP 736" /LENGTH=329 /DNA_ID=CAMNT_0027180541 /DNA_START=81 /DNA_END=1070 /DNA_ORIENTATION=-
MNFGHGYDNFGDFHHSAPPGAFSRHYRCYPVSFLEREELERGDKIVLPPSALDQLSRLEISFPMLFTLVNPTSAQTTHCGVLEFVATEGHMYVPYWMMSNLGVGEGDLVTVENAVLKKGTFVKLQPQSEDFLDISNPKAVLEASLRNFSCLDQDECIPIHYNNKTFWINAVEVRPGSAISIIDADVNVEFAPPPGYEEKEKRMKADAEAKAAAAAVAAVAAAAFAPAATTSSGASAAAGAAAGSRLQARMEALAKQRLGADAGDSSESSDDEKPPPKEAFPGAGQTLRVGARKGAMLVAPADRMEEEKKKEEPEKPFTPFGGAGRSLRD